MQNIPAVSNNKAFVINAEFVKLTTYTSIDAGNVANGNIYTIQVTGNTNWTAIGANSNSVGTTFTANATGSGNGYAYQNETYTFSSSYKEETFGNVTYTPMGGLLGIGIQQRDIRVTSADTSITISGVSGNNMSIVLGKTIRGSEVEIYRGWYNNNFVLDTSNVAKRFTGIITSYNITEETDGITTDNFVITLNASSYKTVLENRVAGRYTNESSWEYYDSTDSSMNNIASITDTTFDFGMKPSAKSGTTSAAQQETIITQESNGIDQGGL
jgi:hypothetical protein